MAEKVAALIAGALIGLASAAVLSWMVLNLRDTNLKGIAS